MNHGKNQLPRKLVLSDLATSTCANMRQAQLMLTRTNTRASRTQKIFALKNFEKRFVPSFDDELHLQSGHFDSSSRSRRRKSLASFAKLFRQNKCDMRY